MGSDWADLANRIVDIRGPHAFGHGDVQDALAIDQYPPCSGRHQGRRIRLFHGIVKLPCGHGTWVVGLGHGLTVVVG